MGCNGFCPLISDIVLSGLAQKALSNILTNSTLDSHLLEWCKHLFDRYDRILVLHIRILEYSIRLIKKFIRLNSQIKVKAD